MDVGVGGERSFFYYIRGCVSVMSSWGTGGRVGLREDGRVREFTHPNR